MNTRKVCACLAVAAAIIGCGSDDDSAKGAGGSSGASSHAGAGGESDAGASGASDGEASRAAVVKTYAANLAAGYDDSVQDEKDFKVVVDKFLADPTEKNLTAARTAWLASRAHYMLTEGARFTDGPIDKDPPNNEGLINSWPLDEAYIDYTTSFDENGDPAAVDQTVGIINMPELLPNITAEGLDKLNAAGGDENVSAGYHAVEFLLWGQAPADSVGPAKRPASDYDLNGPRANPDRRAKYLTVAIDGIIGHLQDVADGWTPSADYRVGFEAAPDESLTKIFTGLAKFSKGELAGERIRAAYKSKERHDQHDCFSSKTLTDYTRDAIGIQNMYLGKYGDNDGPGLDDLVRAVDPDEDAKLQAMLQASIDAIEAIPEPFEASIAGADSSPGRQAISAAINALSDQGDEFGVAAAKLGLSIMVDDPEE